MSTYGRSDSEEVCVLSASGTAAVVKLQPDVDLKDGDHKREGAKVEVYFIKTIGA